MLSKFGAVAFFFLILIAAVGAVSVFSEFIFGKPFAHVVNDVIFYLMHRR